jgi:tight adherence protein B
VRLLLATVTAAAAVLAAGASAATPPAPFQATAVGRTPFPQRAYVVAVGGRLDPRTVHVRENGIPVRNLSVQPLAASGLRPEVVLALDASDSMRGAPFAAAVGAARTFIANRGASVRIGLVAFNSAVDVLQAPTLDQGALAGRLAMPSQIAYGTRVLDAVDTSVGLLARDGAAPGAVVVLSDGSDVGSRLGVARVIGDARAARVRIYTVALRAPALDRRLLQTLAQSTGGAYVETASAARLADVYASLGRRLASGYVIRYRSTAGPAPRVTVDIAIDGLGATRSTYTPASSTIGAYHRSLAARFVRSWVSLALLSLLVAALVGWMLHLLIERTRPRFVERVQAFTTAPSANVGEAARRRRDRRPAVARATADGFLGRLERDLEIARIGMSAGRVAITTAAVTVAVAVVCAVLSWPLAFLGLLVPFTARAVLSHKLAQVRAEFGEQLPPNLQVLASALRAGHSFLGAFSSAVENAHEPSRSELGRVLADERLGVPIDDAIRRVGARMQNRDLEQVALLAELARTTGGNSAEVLDVVVHTIRERADVRRMVKTLTAQGRMARWILTGLPVATGLGFYAIQPQVMKPLLHSLFGQLLLVTAAAMVAAGSLVIQRIVDIEI